MGGNSPEKGDFVPDLREEFLKKRGDNGSLNRRRIIKQKIKIKKNICNAPLASGYGTLRT
ncbi:hypothetical protein COM64_23115 [Bacillus toyonensis]|nr:hypothetical protein COM64_23115 [Bacillus toyonensis]